MNFVSVEYLALFCAFFVLYYAFRPVQIPLLVLASLVFYGYGQWIVLPLLLIVSFVASGLTFAIMRDRIGDRRTLLIIGVAFNLAVLAFFKYKFLVIDPQPLRAGESLFQTFLYLPLPIGISFYTFHSISLLVDTYKGFYVEDDVKSGRRGLADFLQRGLLYLAFFPQIVAGPIVKAHQFMPQIETKYVRDIPWGEAARWIIWGLFFKCFVADNLNQFTIWMEAPNYSRLGSGDLMLLLIGYSFQIFADFAGYSAIALGSAAILGYRLPINFDRPYIASSFSDFWRRWHISLSSFLREYLYIPLGGNRKGPIRTYLNLILTMGLGGLWHGAALSFLVWGLLHGVALAAERLLKPVSDAIPLVIRPFAGLAYTAFIFLVVSFLWLFFKLQNFDEAVAFMRHALTADTTWTMQPAQYALVFLYAAPVAIVHLLPRRWQDPKGSLAAIIYSAMLFLAIFDKGHADAFIYFQF